MKKGFTLIETILYLGLLAVIMLALFPALYSLQNVWGRVNETEALSSDIHFIKEKIKYYLLNSVEIILPEINSQSDLLRIRLEDDSVYEIKISTQFVTVKNGGREILLNGDHTIFENFLISRQSRPEGLEVVEFGFITNGNIVATSSVYLLQPQP